MRICEPHLPEILIIMLTTSFRNSTWKTVVTLFPPFRDCFNLDIFSSAVLIVVIAVGMQKGVGTVRGALAGGIADGEGDGESCNSLKEPSISSTAPTSGVGRWRVLCSTMGTAIGTCWSSGNGLSSELVIIGLPRTAFERCNPQPICGDVGV